MAAPLPTLRKKLAERRKHRDADNRAIKKLLKLIARAKRKPGHVSDAGVKFIADFEGFYAEPYNDPVGHATVGFGKLLHLGAVTPADRRAIWISGQVKPGVLTRDEARRLLRSELTRVYEPAVLKLFKPGAPLAGRWTQNLHDALVSVAFNLGVGAVTPGTGGFETLGRAIQAGSVKQIADALPLYNRGGGKVLPGLTRRRKAERRLILSGSYKTN